MSINKKMNKNKTDRKKRISYHPFCCHFQSKFVRRDIGMCHSKMLHSKGGKSVFYFRDLQIFKSNKKLNFEISMHFTSL